MTNLMKIQADIAQLALDLAEMSEIKHLGEMWKDAKHQAKKAEKLAKDMGVLVHGSGTGFDGKGGQNVHGSGTGRK